MKKIGFWLILVALLSCACDLTPVSTDASSINELHTPPPLTLSITESYSELFLVDQVGSDYYRQHYNLVSEDRMGEYLLKAVFYYTYEPYVSDYEFVFWLDFKSWQPCVEEISCILLEPQEFLISPDEAQQMARQNGLAPGQEIQSRLVINADTNNRFAWEVTPLNGGAAGADVINQAVFDVETGLAYCPGNAAPVP